MTAKFWKMGLFFCMLTKLFGISGVWIEPGVVEHNVKIVLILFSSFKDKYWAIPKLNTIGYCLDSLVISYRVYKPNLTGILVNLRPVGTKQH